jgi:hypothetical protein
MDSGVSNRARALPRRWIQQTDHFPAGGSKLRRGWFAPRRAAAAPQGQPRRGARGDPGALEMRPQLGEAAGGGERNRRSGTAQMTCRVRRSDDPTTERGRLHSQVVTRRPERLNNATRSLSHLLSRKALELLEQSPYEVCVSGFCSEL